MQWVLFPTCRNYIDWQPLKVSVHARQIRIIISRWNGIMPCSHIYPHLFWSLGLECVRGVSRCASECPNSDYAFALKWQKMSKFTDWLSMHTFHILSYIIVCAHKHMANNTLQTHTKHICIWKAHVQSLRFGRLQANVQTEWSTWEWTGRSILVMVMVHHSTTYLETLFQPPFYTSFQCSATLFPIHLRTWNT